jgi:anti-sigma factor RsiW
MNCTEARPLLGACRDGELDPAQSAAVLEHLQDCTACARLYRGGESLSAALRTHAEYHPVPDRLTQDLLSRYAVPAPAPVPRGRVWLWANAATSLAAVALFALALRLYLQVPGSEELLADQLVSAHVRSLQPGHLNDVLSSDRHTVKPWFDGRVDFSPPVVDLAEQGYPLLGGRLDYVDQRPVTALTYAYRKHIINVFIYPDAGADSAVPQIREIRGYESLHWTRSGLSFWAISDAEAPALRAFMAIYVQETTPAPSGG